MNTTLHKSILRLGLPIAIGQLGIIIMGFADTMMVGHYSTDSLAAASFVNSVFNLISFLLIGYSYGLTPLVSSLYGRGQRREAGSTLWHALLANVSFALVLIAIMTVLYFFVDRMGQPAEILPLVRPYYIVVLISMLFVALFNAMRQFTDGITDTGLAMWILLGGNVLNIFGNWLLIYGVGPFPELGLLGAGLSTLISRILMVLVLGGIILWRPAYAVYREGMRQLPTRLSECLHINRQSYPIALQMGMECGAFTFSGVMAGWLNAVSLATFQVTNTLGTLGFLLYYSFGSSMSIRFASAYGQHDLALASEAARAGRHILLAMCVCSSLLFLFAGRYIIYGFTSDPAVVALSVSLIPYLILYQVGDAMQICYANALRGTAQVSSMMSTAFISYIVINVPLGYVLAFPLGMGIHGLYLAFSAGLFVASALFFYHYRRAMRRATAQATAQ